MSGAGDDLARSLVVGLAGPGLHRAERAWLARRQPAGVILFARNVVDAEQLRALCLELRSLVPGLEIVADHEGGPVAVLAAAVGRPPSAATLGLLDDPDLTRRVHTETAVRLAACGLDRVLAPVADVLSEPRNPVIGVRAFGPEAALVARHVAAAVAGLRAGGLAVCLKHWPGHGGTAADSHLGAAVGAGTQAVAPFLAGLEAGADALMVAHVQPAGDGGLPASLDPAVAAAARALVPGQVLRLYADDITMGALRGPLAARGVAVPPGQGLIEPGDLSAAWCAALRAAAATGCWCGAFPGAPSPATNPGRRCRRRLPLSRACLLRRHPGTRPAGAWPGSCRPAGWAVAGPGSGSTAPPATAGGPCPRAKAARGSPSPWLRPGAVPEAGSRPSGQPGCWSPPIGPWTGPPRPPGRPGWHPRASPSGWAIRPWATTWRPCCRRAGRWPGCPSFPGSGTRKKFDRVRGRRYIAPPVNEPWRGRSSVG